MGLAPPMGRRAGCWAEPGQPVGGSVRCRHESRRSSGLKKWKLGEFCLSGERKPKLLKDKRPVLQKRRGKGPKALAPLWAPPGCGEGWRRDIGDGAAGWHQQRGCPSPTQSFPNPREMDCCLCCCCPLLGSWAWTSKNRTESCASSLVSMLPAWPSPASF